MYVSAFICTVIVTFPLCDVLLLLNGSCVCLPNPFFFSPNLSLLPPQDEVAISSTNAANLLQSSFNLTPTVTSIIGPKAEVKPPEQPPPQAPPPTHTLSNQQKVQPVPTNHTAPPKQPQQMLQTKRYSEADLHSCTMAAPILFLF